MALACAANSFSSVNHEEPAVGCNFYGPAHSCQVDDPAAILPKRNRGVKGLHVFLIKDVEAPEIVSVGDALRCRKYIKWQELLAVCCSDQRLAEPQRVQLKVDLEQCVDDF